MRARIKQRLRSIKKESEKNKKKKEKQGTTLRSFLEDNQALLTIFGILAASTSFFLNLNNDLYCYYLSFSFLFMTILVWFQFVSKVVYQKALYFDIMLFQF